MSEQIHLGISTCPNDTYAFHGILNRKIDLQGLEFRIELLDVEELNRRLMAGEFDVAKASFHAALLLTGETLVLPAGSALGFGVGPVLLSNQTLSPQEFAEENHRPPTVLCPGQHTTAHLLYRLFHKNTQIDQAVFSEIMPGLQNKKYDFGVCIHEGRFSYQAAGLHLIEDLGTTWEEQTASPLPLGGILGRRSLGSALLKKILSVIQASIQYAHEHRLETLATMQKYAQEFSDEVLMAHVDLYVNEWTTELGEVGRSALQKLGEIAQQMKIVEEGCQLQVL